MTTIAPPSIDLRHRRAYFPATPGDTSTPLAQASAKLLARVQKFASDANDLRAATRLTDDEVRSRTATLAAEAIREIEATAKEIEATAQQVDFMPASIAWARPHHAGSTFAEVQVDLALAAKFASLPPGERAAILHGCKADPANFLRWGEALARTDPALTGLSVAERNAVSNALTAAFKPTEWATFTAAAQQAEAARATIAQAISVLREVSPAAAAALSQAPTLARAAGWTNRAALAAQGA